MSINCCKSYVGKQIIGLLPGGAEECWYLVYLDSNYFGYSNWTGWTLNGNDLVTELTAICQAQGGNVAIRDGITNGSVLWGFYLGTSDTTYAAYDPANNESPISFNKVAQCEACYQFEVPYGENIKGINVANIIEFLSITAVDDEAGLQTELELLFGTQVSVSSVWNGSNYIVTINNAWDPGAGISLVNSSGSEYIGSLGVCPITPPEPVPFYLLDLYGGAGAAYSVRRLSSTYSGAALRVRRSSDNGEQDIGFDSNGNLDTSALTSFVGANNGFVVKWYDQTGNLRHMAEVNGSQQPSIVSSGSVITRNGIISLFFNSSSSNKITSNYGLTNGPISTIGVLSLSGTNGNAFIQNNFFGIGVLASNFWGYLSGASVSAVITTVPSSVQYTTGSFALTNNASYLVYGNWNGNSNVVKSRRNGISAANSGVSGSTIRKNDTGPQSYLIGYATELIVYPSDQASNVAGMETNINGYYNIYP